MSRHGRNEEETIEEVRAQRDQLAAELVAALAQLDRIGAASGMPVAADGTGPIARVQGHRATGHRAPKPPRERPPWLKVVPALAPLAVLARLAVRGSATRKITGVALAAMVGVPAAVAGTHVIERTPYQVTAPAAVSVTVPAVPSPAGSPAVVTRPRRRRKPALVVVPPAPEPPLSPSPSPTTPPPSPAALTVPSGLDLGVYVAGQVTIGNPQDQAVSWSVGCGQDVTVSPSQGVLEPGQQGVQLTVQADPVDGAAGAVCRFWPGGEVLRVTWAGAGSPSSGT